ncbi:MAG: hypothetical protein MUQ00_09760 [Candidatus Aminicenantes bacterium]|nr:hypothetical protein [Candidatus Aminicenantes bacterium]
MDETSSRLPRHSDFSHSVAVGDIDGDIDLFICPATQDYFVVKNLKINKAATAGRNSKSNPPGLTEQAL